MMAGVLVTSIAAVRSSVAIGRYKPFPIVGTALMAIAMVLLTRHQRLDADMADGAVHARARPRARHDDAGARARRTERRALRAARRRHLRLDALPTGRRLDRRRPLRRDLRQPARHRARRRAPAGRRAAGRGEPRSRRTGCRRRSRRPTSRRSRTRSSPSSSSRRRVSLLAFALTWLLREVPLRKSVAAEGISESFAMPREAESLPELQRIVTTLARRENHWRVYDQLARRTGLDLEPAELWLLARIGEGTAVDLDDPRLGGGRRLAPGARAPRRTATSERRGGGLRARARRAARGPLRAPRRLGARGARRGEGDARPPRARARRRAAAPATA